MYKLRPDMAYKIGQRNIDLLFVGLENGPVGPSQKILNDFTDIDIIKLIYYNYI